MEMNSRRRFSGLALGSLVLALGSMVLLIPAPLAVFFGLRALREVNASDGRLLGRGMAVAAMAVGSVVSVIALVGLFALVAVNLRERGQREECRNNLRRLGVALNRFHDDRMTYPQGAVPNQTLLVERRLSWLVPALPYVGPDRPARNGRPEVNPALDLFNQVDLHQAWDSDVNRAAADAGWPGFHCPAQTASPGYLPSWTYYVGLAGVGLDAAQLPSGDPDDGVFGYERATTRDQVTRGISNTAMVVETSRHNGSWIAAGMATVRGVDPADEPPFGPGRPFGGLHPGGTMVLFVDGSGRFLGARMDAATWASQCRISGD
jgi:prepilin-type processing-associated H-X9-DG protein